LSAKNSTETKVIGQTRTIVIDDFTQMSGGVARDLSARERVEQRAVAVGVAAADRDSALAERTQEAERRARLRRRAHRAAGRERQTQRQTPSQPHRASRSSDW